MGKRIILVLLSLAIVGLAGTMWLVYAAPPITVTEKDCFYLKSLHYTANGMKHWYSKENGGLETISGVPYSKLTCQNCHIGGCDRCHRAEEGDRLAYTTDAARSQPMCLKCHGREKAMIRIDYAAKKEDIHVAAGMECKDCHSGREMHGDGVEYTSLKSPGAMTTRCEDCHDSIKPTEAHTTHEGKLDCKACHIRHVVSCTNCHFNYMAEEGKRKAIPVHDWLFLMNYDGKVTSASMQTFIVRPNKTFLMFAPHMSHSVTKEGRKCDGCHATDTVKKIQKDKKLTLTWLENGEVKNLKAVIPVLEDVEYECVYQDLKDGKWVPVKNPARPRIQYAAFGKPLTKKQLESLAKAQKAPPVKMELPAAANQ
jgi:hypothetical protein